MSTSKRSLEETSSQPKKARFLNNDKDTQELDTTDDLEYKKERKGAIKNEGYESDSSNEGGESVVRSRTKKNDDDDDDMFGGDSDKPKEDTNSSTKPLELGDIEGQEFGGLGDRQAGEDSEGYSSGDAEDEEAEMGGQLSAFNMKEEMQEGQFVDDGTYVENTRDPHAMHDAWMDNTDKASRKRIREAHKERLRKEKEEYEHAQALNAQGGRKEETMIALAEMTQRGETVLEALQRLGKAREKVKKKGGEELKEASKSVEKFTELVNIMVSLGVAEVYDWEHEQFVRNVKRSGYVKDDWVPSSYKKEDDNSNAQPDTSNDPLWEYKQTPTYIASLPAAERPVEVQIFGPFKQTDLLNWVKSGYLGPNGSYIKVRSVNGESRGDWKDPQDIGLIVSGLHTHII